MSQNNAFQALGLSPAKKLVLLQASSGGYALTGGPASAGASWFVNSVSGLDTYSGQAWGAAFKTIAKAVASAAAGDTIYILGSFNEAVVVTSLAGLHIVGAGSTSNEALWTAPDTTAPCLTVTTAADVLVSNIRFRPPLGNAAISLIGASSQFKLSQCRIQGKTGSVTGLLTDGGQSNVALLDNEFFYINTAATSGHAILGQTYSGSEPTGWVIRRNIFNSNTYHIVCRQSRATIIDNTFLGIGLTAAGTSAAPSVCMDISGSAIPGAGCNIVTRNFLGGAYTTALYVSGTNDNWTGNNATANGTTCVQGLTVAVPAP